MNLISILHFQVSNLFILHTMTQLTWLVTGCSSGFGEALVHEILARGDRVIATGRNASERLKHLEDLGAAILDVDVTASQAELDSKVKEAVEIHYGIDVLVNNAGYFELGLIEEVRYVLIMSFRFFSTFFEPC
jgi:NAD(P)-dependent dehydrogenase (short-subunit alcohol dehydrogenase family)